MLNENWKVSEFMCFKLECGGKIICWLYFIFFSLFTVLSTLGIAFVFVDCTKFQSTYQLFESCAAIKIVSTVIAVAIITFSIIVCVIFKRYINGINEHDHTKMRLGVIFCAIINTMLVIIDIAGMFVSFRLLDIVDIALTIIMCVYFFVCLRSLNDKIQRENECKINGTEKEANLLQTAA